MPRPARRASRSRSRAWRRSRASRSARTSAAAASSKCAPRNSAWRRSSSGPPRRPEAMAGSARRVFHVAFAEGFRTGGSFNKRTSIALLAIGLATSLIVPQLLSHGLDFDRGLYRVAITSDSPLVPAVQGSRLFRLVDADPATAIESGAADLVVTAQDVSAVQGSKGAAALAALKQAAKDYTFRELAQESDQGAAFPVRVFLTYQQQARFGQTNALPAAPPEIPQ